MTVGIDVDDGFLSDQLFGGGFGRSWLFSRYPWQLDLVLQIRTSMTLSL